MVDHVCLISRYGDGKSTLASQFSPEYLVLDYDGRWDDMQEFAKGKSHMIKTTDVMESITEMSRRYPDLKGKVGTVIVDSGTSVMEYIQSVGRLKSAEARANNNKFDLNTVHLAKADTMRALRGAIIRYQCNSVWIFHIEDGMMSGKVTTRSTISKLELERLKSGLNVVASIVRDQKSNRRGLKIEWTRYNDNIASGQVIWDYLGYWQGIPEKMSKFIRGFKGTEGYNGNQYSMEWLVKFLGDKGVSYSSVEECAKALGVTRQPQWWDRNSWSAIIEKALPK